MCIVVESNYPEKYQREEKESHILLTLCSYIKGSIFKKYIFFLAKPELLTAVAPILAFVPNGTGFSGNKKRDHSVRFCLGLTLMFPCLGATLNIS